MTVPVPDEVLLESNRFETDDLRIFSVKGREAMSQLFDFHIELVSLKGEVSAADVVGAPASLVFYQDGNEIRRISGLIASVVDPLDTEKEFRSYQFRLVPLAYNLTLVEMQECYLEMTVPDIIKQKFELVGLEDNIDLHLVDNYEAREFVVQYRESDVAFISRWTEHLGMSFYFDHIGGESKAVFVDAMTGFPDHASEPNIEFRQRGDRRDLFSLKRTSQVIPATYCVQDYNYRTPQIDLTSMHELDDGFAGGVIEYGTHFKTEQEGAKFAQIRSEERRSTELVYEGQSDQCTLSPGFRFTASNHPGIEDTELLITGIEHTLSQAIEKKNRTVNYENSFTAVPTDRTYRPPRRTPRPRIHGLLNGIVEAADTPAKLAIIDDEGRYKIQLIFDSAAPGRPKASRPIRMAQPHSGPGYGSHFPLKPGIEVLLAFVDGDPDRPIIVGSVPNPATPSPVTAADATKNRLRTRSGVLFEIEDGT